MVLITVLSHGWRSPNGQAQILGYDALRRLISWQNAPSSPTSTASYAYDGEGQRVQQSVTSNGTTTTTSYIGSYEEVSTTSGTTVVTKYYQAGPATVENVGGTYSYLAADAQGSVSVALSSGGAVTASQLFAPYGATRYSSGVMPTSYGYTGQRSDPSGLAYFHARYYDPMVGQFTSADSAQGLNRYGYVKGNPTTLTDPSGNFICPGPKIDGQCLNIPSIVASVIIGRGKSLAQNVGTHAANQYVAQVRRAARQAKQLYNAAEGTREYNRLAKQFGQDMAKTETAASDYAEAEAKASFFDKAYWGSVGIAGALDGIATGVDYYQSDTKDKGALRVEKSVVAGAVHAVIVTSLTIGTDAAVDAFLTSTIGAATFGVGTPAALALSVGADVLIGAAAGLLGDAIVQHTPVVNDITNVINNTGSAIQSFFAGW